LETINRYRQGDFDQIINHVLQKSQDWNFINKLLNKFNLESYVEILIKAIKYGQIGIIYKYLNTIHDGDMKLILIESLDNLEIFKYIIFYCYDNVESGGRYALIEAICRNKINIVNEISLIINNIV
jgi:hypothetical protein